MFCLGLLIVTPISQNCIPPIDLPLQNSWCRNRRFTARIWNSAATYGPKPNRVILRVNISPVAIGFLASGALQAIPRILDPSVGIIRRRHRAFKPLRIHDPITHVRSAEPE